MCDGYSQSMQHVRLVTWLERGPLVVPVADDADASASNAARPAAQVRLDAGTGSLRRRVSVLLTAVAGASTQNFSVEQPPVGR